MDLLNEKTRAGARATASLLITLLLFPFLLSASNDSNHPFTYDLHLTTIPGTNSDTEIMVCLHGMGGDYKIAQHLKDSSGVKETLVSFNFPDHNLNSDSFDATKTTFGTIEELLPVFFVLKKVVVEDKHDVVNFYGFSAGGGAVINTLAVLKESRYDDKLKTIGITKNDKERILQAVQNGCVILDTPLKSLHEIADFRGNSTEIDIVSERFQNNQMNPIDVIQRLHLPLNIIVHFQSADMVLSNRDDDMFFERLKLANLGSTTMLIGHDSGHSLPHTTLWNFYPGWKSSLKK